MAVVRPRYGRSTEGRPKRRRLGTTESSTQEECRDSELDCEGAGEWKGATRSSERDGPGRQDQRREEQGETRWADPGVTRQAGQRGQVITCYLYIIVHDY